MRFAAALLALCACNRIFGVSQAQLSPPTDAQYFDGLPDAPFQCPPIGQTPHFSQVLNQPIITNCEGYMISEDFTWATAACDQISQGPVDGALTPIAAFDSTDSHPALAPEGDELFVLQRAPESATGRMLAYSRNSDNTWSSSHTVDTTLTFELSASFGAVTRGPTRHAFVFDGPFTNLTVHEVSFDESGAGMDLGVLAPADLQLTSFAEAPNLSSDGLRMVFAGDGDSGAVLYYSDRPDLSSSFRPADVLAPLTNVFDPFMTADCSRLYFSALGSILYVQQGG